MTSAIILPPLSAWVEGKIDALFKATSQEQFDGAYDGFVSKHAHIVFNGKKISHEEYRNKLANGPFPKLSATVAIENSVFTGVLGKQLTQIEGVAGLSFTNSAEYKGTGGNVVRSDNASSINIRVEEDESLRVPPPPHLIGIHGYHDYRRAFEINHISETHTVAV